MKHEKRVELLALWKELLTLFGVFDCTKLFEHIQRVSDFPPFDRLTGYIIASFRLRGIGHEARAFIMTSLAQQGIQTIYNTQCVDNRYTVASPKSSERRKRYGVHTLAS